jgi:predicted acylesterase/phospholipase RssA
MLALGLTANSTGPNMRDPEIIEGRPRSILALDGGGVRGAITVAFLERIEALLSERDGRPVRLCDYFDMVGGTSTGAIIAGALSLGLSASQIKDFYFQLAPRVFRRARFRLIGVQSAFDTRALVAQIGSVCGDRKLESPDIRTNLVVVTKRMDTGGVWFVTNNPNGKFWHDPPDKSYIGNRHYRLADILRASTAAPHYFAPEQIMIAQGEPHGLFIDGGVTAHNNPSIALIEVATVPAYGYGWPVGADNLFLVSVGTGTHRERMDTRSGRRMLAGSFALRALLGMIQENARQALLMTHLLGTTSAPWTINSEIGDLGGFTLPPAPLFGFMRYNVVLEPKWLNDELGLVVPQDEVVALRRLDNVTGIPRCYEIAKAAAERFVHTNDLVALKRRES